MSRSMENVLRGFMDLCKGVGIVQVVIRELELKLTLDSIPQVTLKTANESVALFCCGNLILPNKELGDGDRGDDGQYLVHQ